MYGFDRSDYDDCVWCGGLVQPGLDFCMTECAEAHEAECEREIKRQLEAELEDAALYGL